MADHEQERDKLLDHEYDGIREYDNPLPSWWKWLFVASMVLAFPYTLHFHFGQGLNLSERLEAEVGEYAMQLLATYGELQPDQETLMSYMQDETAMAGMAGLFRGKCAQCHMADGSGQTGPNLTDEYWKNVKQIEDIPRIIREGIPATAMVGWGDRLTETQIVLLGSYIATLRDRPIDGRKPEGEPLPTWAELATAHEPSDAAETASEAAEVSALMPATNARDDGAL